MNSPHNPLPEGLMMLLTAACLLLAIGLPRFVHATPTVIYDSGNTQPLARYIKSGKTQAEIDRQQQAALGGLPLAGSPHERLAIQAKAFPVRTPEMTPGTVTSKSIGIKSLERPVFIIGADKLSAGWLQRHRQRLQTLHAIGLVVNVNHRVQLAQLQAIGIGLDMHALPGSSLAKQFALVHYPVLISATRIEQ